MFRIAAILGLLLVFASSAWPQGKKEDVLRDLKVENLEAVLKAAWKQENLNKKELKANYRYFYSNDQWIDFYYGKNGGQKFLLYQMVKPLSAFQQMVTLQKLNDWNIGAVYTRAYFYRGQDKKFAGVTVEGTMPLDGGISTRQFGSFFDQLHKEIDRFPKFIGGFKAAPKIDTRAVPDREERGNSAAAEFTSAIIQQDKEEVAIDFTPEVLEKILKSNPNSRDYKKKEFNAFYRYQTNDSSWIDYYHGKTDGRKFLLFQRSWVKNAFKQEVTFEKLNDWNVDAVYSRAYFFRGQDKSYVGVILEATLPLDAGVGGKQLGILASQFDKEFSRFLPFVGGLKDGPPDKKAVVPPIKKPPQNTGPVETVRQGFPAVQAEESDLTRSDSAWQIEWDFAPVGKEKIFRIVSATYSWKDVNKKPRSLVVARNLQLVEAFTQYDDGKTSWLDVAKVGLGHVPGNEKFLGPNCVGQGALLESKIPGFNKKVYKELHYDGLRWMSLYGKNPPDKKTFYDARRGEKLVLWSAIASGNYVYLMEYNFTDDGRIVCRLGFTAHNYFDRAKLEKRRNTYGFREKDGDVHPHIGCWRLDFDLTDPATGNGGPETNDLKIVRRVFENNKFRQDAQPFPGNGNEEAEEGKARWVAKQFTHLRAQSTEVKNNRGLPIAYDLITTRTGSAEDLMAIHQAAGTKMDFVNFDFWVTRTPEKFKHYYELPTFAKGQPLAGQRTTIWHSVPALHVPRDEDFGPGGQDAERGAALTEWIGFTLRPRNLFDSTPFYP